MFNGLQKIIKLCFQILLCILINYLHVGLKIEGRFIYVASNQLYLFTHSKNYGHQSSFSSLIKISVITFMIFIFLILISNFQFSTANTKRMIARNFCSYISLILKCNFLFFQHENNITIRYYIFANESVKTSCITCLYQFIVIN